MNTKQLRKELRTLEGHFKRSQISRVDFEQSKVELLRRYRFDRMKPLYAAVKEDYDNGDITRQQYADRMQELSITP